MNKLYPSLIAVGLLVVAGCQTLAIRTMGGIMDYGFEAFNEEADLKLAEDALGSNLKLLDALIKAEPDNRRLLLLASQGYSAYALSFAEDEDDERARLFYLRGRDYALRILNQNRRFREAFGTDVDMVRSALKTLSNDDVPALFWAAFGWGGYINLTRTRPAAIADLPTVNAMMEFVLEREPAYYYGGAHLYFGAALGSTPPLFGGDPEAAKEHFEKGLAINAGRFLMTYVYYAKTYAVQVQDRELFNELLTKVDEASLDVLPEARLANAVAKRKARSLRARAEELF